MKKTYDTEMIRDFIDHLRWELRIKRFENAHKRGTQHPELTERLDKYIRKRNTKSLLYTARMDKTGLSEDRAQEAIDVIRERAARQAQAALDALCVLEPIFQEVINCASHPEVFLVRTVNLAKFLKHMEEQKDQENR